MIQSLPDTLSRPLSTQSPTSQIRPRSLLLLFSRPFHACIQLQVTESGPSASPMTRPTPPRLRAERGISQPAPLFSALQQQLTHSCHSSWPSLSDAFACLHFKASHFPAFRPALSATLSQFPWPKLSKWWGASELTLEPISLLCCISSFGPVDVLTVYRFMSSVLASHLTYRLMTLPLRLLFLPT